LLRVAQSKPFFFFFFFFFFSLSFQKDQNVCAVGYQKLGWENSHIEGGCVAAPLSPKSLRQFSKDFSLASFIWW